MNVLLEKLLLNNLLNDKDRYEIRQIFNFVDDKKKLNILNNFENIINKVLKIKSELKDQQEILLGKAISNIELSIKQAKNNGIKNATSSSIKSLKEII
ncbi:hypothetical protein H3C61_02135 [Candidatus Gracilibacteria bacterium]|nr:hypothetical protein [Candidatus Gracilibacteria bacterium]